MAKRRRIRWDRVTITAGILIILIFLLGSCVHSCTENREEESSGSGLESRIDSIADHQSSGASSVPDSQPAESSGTPAIPFDYQEIMMTTGDVYKGNLVLVNEANPSHLSTEELDLEQVFYAADRPDCYPISYPGHTSFNRTALSQFNRMMKAYYTATGNKEIMFNYGYVEVGKEKSNAESATGLDVQLHLKLDSGGYSYISNSEPYSWIFTHMASYGFIQRYPEEKADLTGTKATYTALRYVGFPHASYITEHQLCLEEYLQLLKNSYTFGTSMLSYTAAEQTYQIYYVPASDTGDTAVPVPKTGWYEVSGNNLDGFIVTASEIS